MKKQTRSYVQTARRQSQEKTRTRIVKALVELHQEVGPKNTTIAAVAKRAGVQRLTVYRHFEDETAMLQACSGHWSMQNPPPIEEDWAEIVDTDDRTQAALLAINTYFSDKEGMLTKVYRDAPEIPALGLIMQGFDDYFSTIADKLTLDLLNGKSNPQLRSVARHLVRFSTWQSLSKENLTVKEIALLGWAWLKKLSS
ncbi:MAG: TetR/AcrR family transcriptional regulator [Verrucomicrobia bacterium]|nr:TetR/AcrR family transcriptional regulator [Verrucomicrobiota bacterium]MDA1067840.1 TetR/AcrR family transcriptional regulator [Verrucomicrobiota bacterium]